MKPSNKQKIMNSAIDLFSEKGYTETTVRELAAVSGVKEASLYNYFPSKSAILDFILSEYSRLSREIGFFLKDNLPALEKNPTADDIVSCLMQSLPEDTMQYYLKVLHVILQEQHRNPLVSKLMCEKLILDNERAVKTIFHTLKDFDILHPDTDPDFWMKVHSSLLYAFSSRLFLGIGDNSPEFSGKGLAELLRDLYSMLLATCSVRQPGSPVADAGDGAGSPNGLGVGNE